MIYIGDTLVNNGITISKTVVEYNDLVEKKDINFYDYDGSRLYSYTPEEFYKLEELPSCPTYHENLTADGWNWTLEEINEQLFYCGGDVNVGCMYHTTDEKTHFLYRICEDNEYMCSIEVKATAANAVTVDWGDGNSSTITTTAVQRVEHKYEGVTSPTDIDVSISCSSGTYAFPTTYFSGAISYETPTGNISTSGYYSIKYTPWLIKAWLSSKVTSLSGSCFNHTYRLETISVPSSITSIGTYVISKSPKLKHFNVPKGITSLGDNFASYGKSLRNVCLPNSIKTMATYSFYICTSLESITLPKNMTTFGTYNFDYCTSLKKAVIPEGVTYLRTRLFEYNVSLSDVKILGNITTMDSYCFSYCLSLRKLTIPGTYTSIPERMAYSCFGLSELNLSDTFTSIGSYAFSGNYNIERITIPEGVTTISTYAFSACYSLKEVTIPSTVTSIGANVFTYTLQCKTYWLKPTTPPTVSTNSIAKYPGMLIIVPKGCLSTYLATSNWSSYAAYMVEDDDIQEIEYIESNGYQYIDTGVVGPVRIVAKGKGEQTSTVTQFFYGRGISTGTYCGSTSSRNKWDAGGPTPATIITDYPITEEKEVDITYTTTGFNGYIGETNVYNNASFTYSDPWKIGYNNTSYRSLIGRTYYFKMYKDGELVRDFIPVRINTIVGMYDRVQERIYLNSGTGSYTAGPDVVSGN